MGDLPGSNYSRGSLLFIFRACHYNQQGMFSLFQYFGIMSVGMDLSTGMSSAGVGFGEFDQQKVMLYCTTSSFIRCIIEDGWLEGNQ